MADGTTTLLLDFGSTGLAALTASMDPARVDGIVVTHLHGDHFGAIPYLVMQQRFASRARPLILAGPPGLEARLRQLSLALYADFYERPLPYELRFVPFGDGELAIGTARIAARRVMHSPDAEPHGVRLRMGGRLIAYTGDAGWSEDLPALASGADLFICEATTYASAWAGHLSAVELAERRDAFGGVRVVLTHIGPEMHAPHAPVAFEVAEDGMTIRL